MNSALNQYSESANDWRRALSRNSRRTYVVIALFILLYILLGLLIDTVFYFEANYQAIPPQIIFQNLITLKLMPHVTIVTVLIAIVSLIVVFMFHDKLVLMGTDYHEVTPDSGTDLEEKQLYNIIEELKIAAGLRYMPRVFIIEADYMNAFASGYSEKSALVAITRGLMKKLDRDETQAVMAHELSHIRHMDIKLTLTATLLSSIMLMIVDMLFWNAYYSSGRRRGGGGGGYLMLIIVLLRYILPLVTMLLLLFLSRTREYMADAGCVELTRNNGPLARALLKISGDHAENTALYSQEYNKSSHDSLRRTAYFFDPTVAGIKSHNALGEWLSTHPTLQKRLAALGYTQKT